MKTNTVQGTGYWASSSILFEISICTSFC